MDPTFAARMHGARRSFIREILKVTADPERIREGVRRLGECMRRCLGSKRPA